jgi:cobalamin biosynthesis protein CobC
LLKHGGGVQQAALKYDLPVGEWLDLSTGINPIGWRVPEIPAAKWLRLPEDGDGLAASAASYFGADNLLPVAGSQAAIQALSRLTDNFRVAVLSPTYAEHAHSWGYREKSYKKPFYYNNPRHQVELLPFKVLDRTIELYDVVVVVNPNNPTGEITPKAKLLEWRQRLADASKASGKASGKSEGRERWLIVDEAFMDSTPEESLILETGKPGLIVLRSLGKFFGLAGVRVGFVFAWPELLDSMQRLLGPWQITGPSRLAAKGALLDVKWQKETRRQLLSNSKKLYKMLESYDLTPDGGTTLFQWVKVSRSQEMFKKFARQGILVRRCAKPGGIRFGLPGVNSEWQRLEKALLNLHKK